MSYLSDLYHQVQEKNPGEIEFHQAVKEVFESLELTVPRHPEFVEAKIYHRIIEPERVILFRCTWIDDAGEVQVNRGYRVQFNSAIGPYKGGLRLHPKVNLSIIKFLGFEQIFKNSLTGLPIGGGKGGSDFDPKGRSDHELLHFIHSFMSELYRHVGPDTDVPAGDIGVGEREIGYMFGCYKKIVNQHTGVLTGKGLEYGGTLIRPEATGYGAVYMACEMLETRGLELNGMVSAVSGSGNVAQYTVEKLNECGSKVITISDSDGTVVDEAGIDNAKLKFIIDLKTKRRGRIKDYADAYNLPYFKGQSVWDVIKTNNLKVDLAFPSAVENEIREDHAAILVENGCCLVCEGANMPCTPEAVHLFQDKGILFGPGKAANAGGVATSGLEMQQNAMRMSWERDEVDRRLRRIMKDIHQSCLDAAAAYGRPGDYVAGANIAGFLKVANAMIAYGII